MLNQLYAGAITEGELLKRVRRDVLNMSQTKHAELSGVSRRTISAFEQNSLPLSLSAYRALFKPIGLQPGLLPRRNIDEIVPKAY